MMDISKFMKGASTKTIRKLASDINPAAAAGPSNWARLQLEKFGWKKGKGLGKEEHGIQDHVKVDKKDANEGLGFDEEQEPETNYDMKYFTDAYSTLSQKIVIPHGSDSDGSDVSDSSDESDDDAAASTPKKSDMTSTEVMYNELFKACKGRRPGRRGFVAMPSKWDRAEEGKKIKKKAKRKAERLKTKNKKEKGKSKGAAKKTKKKCKLKSQKKRASKGCDNDGPQRKRIKKASASPQIKELQRKSQKKSKKKTSKTEMKVKQKSKPKKKNGARKKKKKAS